MSQNDRRRSPRIELMGRLHGHSVSLDLPVRVLEISLGGMSIETPVPLAVGSVHTFRLTLGDDSTTELVARVMHSRNTAPDGATAVFKTGMQFVESDEDPASGTLDGLISRVQ